MKLKEKLLLALLRTKFKILTLVSKRKAAQDAFRLFCTPLTPPSKRMPTIFTWAETIQFKMGNYVLRGYRWNHKREHKVLILHGFSSQAYKFKHYVEPLLEKGYEVIAFDAPAHGRSTGKTVNALEYSDMIVQIMRRYGPVNGYIAHSFGGLALALALEKTKHDAATKVVFIAPATETTTAIDTAFGMIGLKNKMVRKEFDNIIIEKSGQHPQWFSIKRAMKNISASVLWLHDEDDHTTPLSDVLPLKEKNYPNIEFEITSGLGHRRIYKDETTRKRVINFL
ncbi:MAG TPA: alpha/beta fold hydrolase [Ferruginibacter sp.]|nr:alpha/beta fold hydrolase [Ferruginibacter sp.]HMP21893.1 alpha/beta fold hydrolase [Ferruginibacter sp.]